MPPKNARKYKKNKLVIALILITLLFAGYFAYKYTYIFVERRKYDKAAAAIQKVAADLRSEGIETQFSKGCSRNIEVFSKGSTSCGVSIDYLSDSSNNITRPVIEKYEKILLNNGFEDKNIGTLDTGSDVISSGIKGYGLNQLSCTLTYSKEVGTYQITFRCGAPSKFNVF